MIKKHLKDFADGELPWNNVQPPDFEKDYTPEEAETELTHWFNLVNLFGTEKITKLLSILSNQGWNPQALLALQRKASFNSNWNKSSYIKGCVEQKKGRLQPIY